jgi:hypothetical protein
MFIFSTKWRDPFFLEDEGVCLLNMGNNCDMPCNVCHCLPPVIVQLVDARSGMRDGPLEMLVDQTSEV